MFCPSSARVEIAMSSAQEQPEHRITSSEVTLDTESKEELEEKSGTNLSTRNADMFCYSCSCFH